MPDFILTSPEGKSYAVSGPDGTTKEQAYQMLQQRLQAQVGTAKSDSSAVPSTQQSKAKQAVEDIMAPPEKSFGKVLGDIGVSAGLGGALGYLSPEILTGAGALLSMTEVGKPIGQALLGAAEAAQGARLSAAATGALSGGVSETAGQGAELLGASKGAANAVRFGAGLLTPEIGVVAGKVRGLYDVVAKQLGLDSTPAAVAKAAQTLRGVAEAGVPQHALHQALQVGADADIKAAQQAGEKVMQDARSRAAEVASQDAKAAQKILDEGEQRSKQMVTEARQRAAQLDKLSQGRMATAGKVLAQAEPALRVVGQPQELSDIGKTLQQTVAKEHQAALNARQEAYQTLKAQRDAVVQQKEAAGETLDKTPGMKELKQYIDSKTLRSAAGREMAKGMAPVTDQATLRTYENLREAINNRRIQVGVDELGQPKFQTFKTSFEALDQIRRKLGDVVANRDVEGYSAIGKSLATKLYDKISQIQRDYVGEVGGRNLQQEMQESYSGASRGLRKFEVGKVGKVTALDRVDPERFAADPQGVPRQFFSSQQSVQDLKELVKDPGLVERTARSYVAQSLRGQSSQQVMKYAKDNADWMREVPGLQKSVADYAQKLQKIESVAEKVGQRAQQFKKTGAAEFDEAVKVAGRERAESIARAGKAAEGSVETQQRLLNEGQKAAKAATEQAAGPAVGLQKILQNGERPEAVRDLLLNGKPEQTRLAARIAGQTPQGRMQLEQSVRQITARMGEKELARTWQDRLKPMLEDGKMLSPERMKALDTDVRRLLKAYEGPERLSLVQRHIIAAIGSAGADYLP